MNQPLSQRITPIMESLIAAGHAPVKRQFVADPQETKVYPEELSDPIGESKDTPVKGITHRYPDRVLLKPSHRCAVHCRFCFRREQVGLEEADLNKEELAAALAYIAGQPQVWEVILTGGDPLMLRNETLQNILNALHAIEHVKVIRFHTRIPVVLPERISDSLVSILSASPKAVWLVLHTNCAQELTFEAEKALTKLRKAGISLLSQSVLLKGVNATEAELESLFRRLVELGVRPYYLHYPDLARGTHHFRIPLQEALDLVDTLRRRMSGISIPNLAVDIPGGEGKVPLAAAHPVLSEKNRIEIESPLTRKKISLRYPADLAE